ncbi:unnamed protein product [Symbiodinium sp. CCMP2592]|nr:unnamed protein product [Symbiodinium sp. CCMP2592]
MASHDRIADRLLMFLQERGGVVSSTDIGGKYQIPNTSIANLRSFCETMPEHFSILDPGKGPWRILLASLEQDALTELIRFIAARGGSIGIGDVAEFHHHFPALSEAVFDHGRTFRQFCEKHRAFLMLEDSPHGGAWSLCLTGMATWPPRLPSSTQAPLTAQFGYPGQHSAPTHGPWLRSEPMQPGLQSPTQTVQPESTSVAVARNQMREDGSPPTTSQPSGTTSGLVARDEDVESSSECGDTPVPGTVELKVSEIRWAHDSIKVRFRNGMLLVDTLKELLDGRLKPHQLPPFAVWQRGCTWFAITGNRRLWVLRELAAVKGAEVVVRARQLDPGVHLSPWFHCMFSTGCDGVKVQFRAKGVYPSMQIALGSCRSLPTLRELLVAKQLHESSGPVALEVLERRFAGKFSVAEVVLSKPSFFTVTSGQVAFTRPLNLRAPALATPNAPAPTPPVANSAPKAHGMPPARPILMSAAPPKAPACSNSSSSQDPWSSGKDPWSQHLEEQRAKAPPLFSPSGAGDEDPGADGKYPWTAASASSSAPRYRSPPPRRPEGSEPQMFRMDTDSEGEPRAPARAPPKPKPPPPPVPSSSEESEGEPNSPNAACSDKRIEAQAASAKRSVSAPASRVAEGVLRPPAKGQQSPQPPPLRLPQLSPNPGQGQRCICNLGGLLSKMPAKLLQPMEVSAYANVLHTYKAQRLIFQSGWPVQVALSKGWLESRFLPDLRLTQEDLTEIVQRLDLQEDSCDTQLIPGTLHFASLCYVGARLESVALHFTRLLPGVTLPIRASFSAPLCSVLLLGPSSCGKTTALRDAAAALCESAQVVIIDFLAELSAWSFCRARTVLPEEPADPLASVRSVIQNERPEVLIAEFVDGDACIQSAQLCFEAGVRLVASLRNSIGGLTDSFLRCDNGLPGCFAFPFATVVLLRRQLDAWHIFSPAGHAVCAMASGRRMPCALHHIPNFPALRPTAIFTLKTLVVEEEMN